MAPVVASAPRRWSGRVVRCRSGPGFEARRWRSSHLNHRTLPAVRGTAPPRVSRVIETASWGRRVLALIVDWFASTLVVVLVLGPAGWSENRLSSLYTLGVFALESAVLTPLAGGSFGKLATRLRVVRADGRPGPPDLLRSLARAVLVCLVIPPLVFRPDRRGLHDMVAGSATVTLDTYLGRRGR